MSSPIYQNVINMVVCLSIRRAPGVFMDAAMGEHGVRGGNTDTKYFLLVQKYFVIVPAPH
jgi:hypothetical protein